MTTREKRPLKVWLVVAFTLVLPLLPVYLWWQGRLSSRWAGALFVVAALFFGAAVTAQPETESGQIAAGSSEPGATPSATPGTAAPTATESAGQVAALAGIDDGKEAERAAARKAASIAKREAAEARRQAKREAAARAERQAAKAEKKRKQREAARKRREAAAAAAKAEQEKAAQQAAASDPMFGTCGAANDAGYGNYVSGVDVEYSWYDDRDHDGRVCEF